MHRVPAIDTRNRASVASAALLAALLAPHARGGGPPLWSVGLPERMAQIQQRSGGQIGVHVHHLGRNETFSFRGEERWYLASGVKVPVAIAVLRDVDAERLQLDAMVTLEATDFVDGAGPTNDFPAGTRLPVGWLLEQMIIHSDNTAADVLIRTVGLKRINSLARELLGKRDFSMTTLAEVRRLAYAMLEPRAAQLSSAQLLELRRAEAGPARLQALATLLGVLPEHLLLPDLDSAFDAYYAEGLNSASLAQYSRLLAQLARGKVLGRWSTAHLLGLMARIQTGQERIVAALPAGSRFAHKTGTQHQRACDLGIVTTFVAAYEEQVIVSVCTRAMGLEASERALREVGAALVESGVITLPSMKEAVR